MRPLLAIVFVLMACYYATQNDSPLNFGYLKLKFDIGPEEFSRNRNGHRHQYP